MPHPFKSWMPHPFKSWLPHPFKPWMPHPPILHYVLTLHFMYVWKVFTWWALMCLPVLVLPHSTHNWSSPPYRSHFRLPLYFETNYPVSPSQSTSTGDSSCTSKCFMGNQEFITVRVCNSHMVSTPAIWIGWRRQSAVNMLSRYLTWSHSRC